MHVHPASALSASQGHVWFVSILIHSSTYPSSESRTSAEMMNCALGDRVCSTNTSTWVRLASNRPKSALMRVRTSTGFAACVSFQEETANKAISRCFGVNWWRFLISSQCLMMSWNAFSPSIASSSATSLIFSYSAFTQSTMLSGEAVGVPVNTSGTFAATRSWVALSGRKESMGCDGAGAATATASTAAKKSKARMAAK
mmetsp:Transcript_32704/g.82001  ORF Transcript_32704/g.82001 Transcript_32704/m.82001 type:complete len:200 (+) Transcript_32704:1300-1899(+)